MSFKIGDRVVMVKYTDTNDYRGTLISIDTLYRVRFDSNGKVSSDYTLPYSHMEAFMSEEIFDSELYQLMHKKLDSD